MNTSKEKASYCIGLEAGKNLTGQFSDLDLEVLSEGFQDGLIGNMPKLATEEMQQILTALRRQIEAQQREFLSRVAEENKRSGEAFLTQNKEKEGVVTLNSGLQYKVLSQGTGPSPKFLDMITAHYRGSFIDGRMFDSSYERGKPQSFPLNRVIPGWVEALQQMKVGDKWQVVIPHYLAYGEAGFGPHIGPNTTLIFELELLGIN